MRYAREMSTPKSRRGRPRLQPNHSDEDPAEQILRVAAEAFATKGFAGTSLAEIAAGVGLQRASLYHHFASKDAMLAEIARRHLEPLLGLVDRLSVDDRAPALQLYRCLRIDLRHMLRAPDDLGALFHLPEVRDRGRFGELWAAVDRIQAVWTDWIRQGVEDGSFRVDAVEEAGLVLESSYLGVLGTPRARLRSHPARTADAFADFALAALLDDRGDVDRLRAEAATLDGVDPSLS